MQLRVESADEEVVTAGVVRHPKCFGVDIPRERYRGHHQRIEINAFENLASREARCVVEQSVRGIELDHLAVIAIPEWDHQRGARVRCVECEERFSRNRVWLRPEGGWLPRGEPGRTLENGECPRLRSSEARLAWLSDFRENQPTPTMPEMLEALSNPDPERPERGFAYWQIRVLGDGGSTRSRCEGRNRGGSEADSVRTSSRRSSLTSSRRTDALARIIHERSAADGHSPHFRDLQAIRSVGAQRSSRLGRLVIRGRWGVSDGSRSTALRRSIHRRVRDR